MTSGLDEVKARVNTIVDDLLSIHAVLLLQVGIKPRLNVLHDGLPATAEPNISQGQSCEADT